MFYIAYLVLALFIGAISGLLGVLITGASADEAASAGFRFGQVSGVIYILILSFLVLRAKGMLNNFGYIILILLSGVISFFGGAMLGLFLAVFLTTQDKNAISSSNHANQTEAPDQKPESQN